MSFCSTRSRAYSKATREELKELNAYLAQRSADELRSVIHLAATQSSETAHILLKLLNPHTNSPFEPVQAHIKTEISSPRRQRELEHVSSNDGLLTPADSEDSEMSGTENIPRPQQQPQCPMSPTHSSSLFPFTGLGSQSQGQGHTKGLLSPVQERRLKRKSLAEWDDNTVPSPSSRSTTAATMTTFQLLQHSPSTKRRRAALKEHQRQHCPRLSSCVNCGKEYSYSPSQQHAGSLHGCMYHPGILESVETEYQDHDGAKKVMMIRAGRWDCCRGLHSSPGCLVTQHRDVNVDGYRISTMSLSSSVPLFGCSTKHMAHHGIAVPMGARSMFAELFAAGSLVR